MCLRPALATYQDLAQKEKYNHVSKTKRIDKRFKINDIQVNDFYMCSFLA